MDEIEISGVTKFEVESWQDCFRYGKLEKEAVMCKSISPIHICPRNEVRCPKPKKTCICSMKMQKLAMDRILQQGSVTFEIPDRNGPKWPTNRN